MNPVEKIKSGSWKEYVVNAIAGGLMLGLCFFLISLLNSSFHVALIRGFGTSFSIMIFLFLIGFVHEEWYKRSQKIKLLNTDTYKNLNNIGLSLNNDLHYTGYVNGFFIRFYTIHKWTDAKQNKISHSVDIYCHPEDPEKFKELIDSIRKNINIAKAAWGFGIFSIYFKEGVDKFDTLITDVTELFNSFNLYPVNMEKWEQIYGSSLRMNVLNINKKKYIQIFKVGKFHLKFRKNERN